jgi:hypothetical protein
VEGGYGDSMDRRHLVLAMAIAATIATSYPSYSPLEGSSSLTLDTVQLEAGDTRSWVITSEVALPPQAQANAYDSMLSAVAQVSGSEGLQRVSLILRDCDGGETMAQTVVADEPGGGSWIGGQVDAPDFFADCPINECVRTVCLDITNEATSPADVGLEIQASVTSDYSEDGVDLGVPIQLTIEEIDP